MIHQALLVVFTLAGTLGVSTVGRHYNRQKESRAFATRTNLIEMKQPRCGTTPMECLLQCNQLPACPALNAFNNGTCELLLSPVLAVDFLLEATAYIYRFEPAYTSDLMSATTSIPAVPPVTSQSTEATPTEPADTTDLMPATISMPAVTRVPSQPTEGRPTDETHPAEFGHTLNTSGNAACYKFVDNHARSWDDARAHCVSLGSELVAIETIEELKHIASVVTDNRLVDTMFWSSGTYEDIEGMWRWKTTGAPVDLNLPDVYDVSHGNKEECLVIFWSTTLSVWHNGDCAETNYPLCEKTLG